MPNTVYDDKGLAEHDDLGVDSETRAAETDDLERQFDAPSAPERDLQEAEANGGESNTDLSRGESSELGKLGGLYKSEDGDKKRGKKSLFARHKKKFIGGGVVGGGILGLFGAMLISIGPLQLLHLKSILATDSSNNESTSGIRANALYRYARAGGDYGQLRMSYVGEKIFAKSVTQLSEIGITMQRTGTFATGSGVTVDLNKYPSLPGETASAKAVRAKGLFLGVKGINPGDITFKGNTMTVNSRFAGLAAVKQINKASIAQLGHGPITSWVKVRSLNVAAGFRYILSPKRPTAQLQRAIDRGEVTKAVQEEAKAAAAARAVEARSPFQSKALALQKSIAGKTNTKAGAAAGASLLATAVMCTIRDAADEAAEYNRTAVVLPAALAAADAMAVASKTQAGDMTATETGAETSLLTVNGMTILNGLPLAAKLNPDAQGKDLDPNLKEPFGDDSSTTKWRNLGGDLGKSACSTTGTYIQYAVGGILLVGALPTAGGTAAVKQSLFLGAGLIAGVAGFQALHNLVGSSLAQDAVEGNVPADVKGGLLGFGSREYANMGARASGGIELSKEESASLDRQQIEDSMTEFRSRPALARIFDASDYRSVVGRIIDKQSVEPGQNLQNFANVLVRLPSSIMSAIRSILPKAHAANEPYDYGFNRYGIPERVLYNPDYDDPYNNELIVSSMLDKNDSTSEAYIKKARSCFGVDLKNDGQGWMAKVVADVNPRSGDYEDANCNVTNDTMWDRIMLFVNDSQTMEAAGCYENLEDACANLGLDESAEIMPGGSAGGWQWPVPEVKEMGTLGYGELGSKGVHKGIDIGISGGGALGKTVVAAHDGEVVYVGGHTDACGSYIVIKATGTDYYIAYQHVDSVGITVAKGATVVAGQPIAKIGPKGGTTCGSGGFYHLHFSIETTFSESHPVSTYADTHPNGTINPLDVLPQ